MYYEWPLGRPLSVEKKRRSPKSSFQELLSGPDWSAGPNLAFDTPDLKCVPVWGDGLPCRPTLEYNGAKWHWLYVLKIHMETSDPVFLSTKLRTIHITLQQCEETCGQMLAVAWQDVNTNIPPTSSMLFFFWLVDVESRNKIVSYYIFKTLQTFL